MTQQKATQAITQTTTSKVVHGVIWAAITLLYTYALVAAIGNLIGMPQIAAALGVSLSLSGWAWTIIGVALPPAVYTLALLIAKNATRTVKLLVLVAGLCLVAVLQLDVMHLIPRSSYFG